MYSQVFLVIQSLMHTRPHLKYWAIGSSLKELFRTIKYPGTTIKRELVIAIKIVAVHYENLSLMYHLFKMFERNKLCQVC